MDPELKTKIDNLISLLECDEGIKCQKARRQLVRIGQAAVPALITAASNGRMMKRWEAIRALGSLGGADAINALISHLGDSEPGIRWAAADALLKIGEPALAPVLRGVISNGKSLPFREGAHHFLIDAATGTDPHTPFLEPVIKSLEEPGADLAAPVAAEVALEKTREFHRAAGG